MTTTAPGVVVVLVEPVSNRRPLGPREADTAAGLTELWKFIQQDVASRLAQ